MKKIIVLDKITNKEDLFINNVKLQLKEHLVHKLSNTNKIDDVMEMLGWRKKLNQPKYSKLTKELYSVWEDYDDTIFNKITDYIDNQYGENHIFFLYSTNGDRLERLKKLYPKQIVSFDLNIKADDSNLNDEINRLLENLN